MNKTLHTFSCMGSHCEADLYLPPHSAKPPVVVLAQGYGAERTFGTRGIVTALVEAGIAVFAFDYRGFGGSETIREEFRQLIDPARQLEDWQAALAYVHRLPQVDGSRLGLWGSSFAGGHVLSVAGSEWSRVFNPKAVVAQIPHCDSRSAFKQAGLKMALRALGHGLKGMALSALGINYTVAIIGKPEDETFSVLHHPDWYEGYMRIAAGSATWQNAMPAKSLLTVSTYHPIDYAAHIPCPVLMVYGLKDSGIPLDDVERTANLIKEVERFTFDGDHFDAYDGGLFNAQIIAREVAFLKAKLPA
jgi:dipeptidyl aminopeptidase/acylaminoacyl peptidase